MKAAIYKAEGYKLMGAAFEVYNEQGYGLAERPRPGGLPDISRGLSVSDTPGTPSKPNRTLEGCQKRPGSSARWSHNPKRRGASLPAALQNGGRDDNRPRGILTLCIKASRATPLTNVK